MTKASIFSEKSITFLQDLKKNNNKQWFEDHREEYENYLLNPMRKLVENLGPFMLSIDEDFELRPAVGKTISRINRDTRFSKNKSPYKANIWLTFKQPNKDWKDAPAYFFEISHDSYAYGMGFFNASPNTMSKFRELIEKNFREFKELVKIYKNQKIFAVGGDKYKKTINENLSEEIQDFYQRKNLYFLAHKKPDKKLFSENLTKTLLSHFQILSDFYHFMLKVKK